MTAASVCRTLAVSAAMLAATSCVVASAQSGGLVERLYVFGDSYSDSGNGYALTRQPQSPPYASRYSNGPTAVEHMARTFGLTLLHSEEPNLAPYASLNFAVSGAWTSRKNNDAPMDGKTGLLNQVDTFEDRVRQGKTRFRPEATLFFMAIGTNDVLFGNLGRQDNRTIVANARRNVEQSVRRLHAAGARHIAIATLPMVNRSPRGRSLPASTAEAVAVLNREYRNIAETLRAALKADVFLIPWGQYYDDVIANPTAFGFSNPGPCVTNAAQGLSVCLAPEQSVFWDVLHPTTATHKVVGLRLAAQGEPHFTCAVKPSTDGPSESENPVCRFLSGADGAAPGPQPMTACGRVVVRQFADMCGNCTRPPWTGEITKMSAQEWSVDSRERAIRAQWRLVSQVRPEMLFYDVKRDLYTRFDLPARKGWQRRGAGGPWVATSDILETDCQ